MTSDVERDDDDLWNSVELALGWDPDNSGSTPELQGFATCGDSLMMMAISP